MAGFNTNDVPGAQVGKGQPDANMLRQYGSIPQTLAANNVPAVLSTSGLGTGGGASVQIGQTNGSQGTIDIITGSNPSVNGNVELQFPNTAPTLFLALLPEFGTPVVTNPSATTLLIAWTSDTFLPNKRYKIPFQWATSK